MAYLVITKQYEVLIYTKSLSCTRSEMKQELATTLGIPLDDFMAYKYCMSEFTADVYKEAIDNSYGLAKLSLIDLIFYGIDRGEQCEN